MKFSIKLMILHELRPFCTKTVIFVQSCKIQWSNSNIKELSGSFLMTMRNFRIFMQNQLTHLRWLATNFLIQFISHSHAKFSLDHVNLQHLVFELLFVNSSIFFFLTPSQLPLISSNPSLNQLHYFFQYAFSSSSTLLVPFNSIHLFCHQFIKIIP